MNGELTAKCPLERPTLKSLYQFKKTTWDIVVRAGSMLRSNKGSYTSKQISWVLDVFKGYLQFLVSGFAALFGRVLRILKAFLKLVGHPQRINLHNGEL